MVPVPKPAVTMSAASVNPSAEDHHSMQSSVGAGMQSSDRDGSGPTTNGAPDGIATESALPMSQKRKLHRTNGRQLSFSDMIESIPTPPPSAPSSLEDGGDTTTQSAAGAAPCQAETGVAFKKKLIRRLSSIPYAGKNSTMAQFDCLERPLSIFFYRYARWISRYPIPAIVFPLLLTGALAIGLLHSDPLNDAIYLFTPTNAPSKYEREVIHEKWPLHNDNYVPGRAVTQSRECQVIAKAKNGGNILDLAHSNSVHNLNLFVRERIKVTYEGRLYGFDDLCLKWKTYCVPNQQINPVAAQFQRDDENVTFPATNIFGTRVYLASSLGGVMLHRGVNDTYTVASARAWVMLYHLKFHPDNDSYVSGLWEREFERRLLDYPWDPYIDVTLFHSQTLTEELKRNAETLVPRFICSFSLLIAFAVICSITTLKNRWTLVDWTLSKPLLALCGVLNAGMGVISAIGLLNFVGVNYTDIVMVMPFLVVSIGVDNMFLMAAALRRTDRLLPADRRVGEAMSDAAISISITALTDALSFGVGAITTIPAVQIFCVYTAVAIVFTFIYQLTFFLGLLVLHAKYEERGRHCVLACVSTIDAASEKAEKTNCWNSMFMLGSRPDRNSKKTSSNVTVPLMSRFFSDWYAPVLMEPVVRAVAVLWFAIYLAFAIYGCTKMREGLEPVNLLVKDSYAIPHYRRLEKYFWGYGAEVQLVFNNAPNFTDPEERNQIQSVLHSFANTRHTIGIQGVSCWLWEMKHYFTEVHPKPLPDAFNRAFYQLARHFVALNTYDTYGEDIVWDDDEKREYITAFRCFVGMRNIRKTNDQREATELLRDVASRYPRYNITTFMPLWLFTDQYRLILPNTLQNIGIAMGCMLVISLLLIPQPVCALWVAVAIASIDVGVVGYMTLWGVNLDAISMITIIMSIGFSVDFSAHITYGYVISEQTEPTQRVRVALGALGWPILQGAISTVIGVAILSTVEAYMIVTFFKTVFLVIVLGALHGLVFLPVLLSLFVRGKLVAGGNNDKKKKKKKSKNNKKHNEPQTPSDTSSPLTVTIFRRNRAQPQAPIKVPRVSIVTSQVIIKKQFETEV